MPAAPYLADTRAKGWRFELDYERIEQSSTWALAGAEARPWLLMMWLTAWRQVPCGSFPAEEQVIAAMIGAPAKTWAKHRAVLLRGWWLADDGRLYHNTLTQRVQQMLDTRGIDRARQDARQKILETVRERDGRACVYCGHSKYLTLDHLLPLSRGGDNDERNLAMACRPCNSKKGARTPDEAGMAIANAATFSRWRQYMQSREAPTGIVVTPSFSGGEKPRNDTGTGTGTSKGNTENSHDAGGGAQDDPVTAGFQPTQAGSLCRALRQAGIADVNPGHPRLLALLSAGAGPAEFTGFVPAALANSQRAPFAYLLGMVEGERKRAASMAGQLHRGAMPNRQEAIEQRNQAAGDAWLAEQGAA